MATLLYSPAIRVRISTVRDGILDVSDDLVDGGVSLRANSPGTADFTINNYRRKYDGVFTPNDRIVVSMKRIKWMQVFSGYLNEVPYFSVYPRSVRLTATDSLKRLYHHLWDEGSPAAFTLLHGVQESDIAKEIDGGLRTKTIRLLTEVVGWPKANIHIGGLPPRWFEQVTKIQADFATRFAVEGPGTGADPAMQGTAVVTGGTSLPGIGPYTGVLPSPTTGRASWFGGPNGGAYNNMALSGESGTSPNDSWYAAMRFPYQGYVNGRITRHGSPQETRAAINWWKQQRLVVTAPKTGKSIVVRCADWGPGGVKTADDRIIDLSKQGLEALGIPTDGQVTVRFAEPTSKLGPVTVSAKQGTQRAAHFNDEGNVAIDTRPTLDAAGHPIENAAMPAAAATGLKWQGEGGLQPHVRACRDFIKMNWPNVPSIGGIGQRSGKTDHDTGHALDVMVNRGGVMPTAEERGLGNSVALWMIQNPDAFGIKYVIWDKRIMERTRQGWSNYTRYDPNPGPTLGHYDHVHISFVESQGQLGPMGNAWTGSSAAEMNGDIGPGASLQPGTDGSGTANLINTIQWQGRQDPLSSILSGPRVLLNDRPVMETISKIVKASMRDFMAAPNGDFIAWFPDYFGIYKQAGRLHIADVELVGDGFTMQWSDDHLITHQFVTGSATGYSSSGLGGVVESTAIFDTMGIASVEFPEIMAALFNVDVDSPAAKNYFSAAAVLKRFGARVDHTEMGTITGPVAEFWYALKLFQEKWAQQFSSQVNTTFLPEAWPGMLMVLDNHGFQAYIEGVSHRFDFSQGAGFTTSLSITAPSALDGSGLYGLPKGGNKAARRTPAKKAVDD